MIFFYHKPLHEYKIKVWKKDKDIDYNFITVTIL